MDSRKTNKQKKLRIDDSIYVLAGSVLEKYNVTALATKFACSIPGWDDGFTGWENWRHACHVIMWHVKDPLSTHLARML